MNIIDKNVDWYLAQLTQEKEAKLVSSLFELFSILFLTHLMLILHFILCFFSSYWENCRSFI